MKTIIFFFLMFLSISVNAQLKVNYSIEFGITQWRHTMFMGQDGNVKLPMISTGVPGYADIGISAKWKGITVSNDIITFMDYENKSDFTPRYTEYKINIKYTYKFASIGYGHSCTHPIWNSPIDVDQNIYRAYYDRLYLKFEF
jgi:hypothetical protein